MVETLIGTSDQFAARVRGTSSQRLQCPFQNAPLVTVSETSPVNTRVLIADVLTPYFTTASSKLPILALETVVSHLLEDVICYETYIELHSTSVSSLRELSERISEAEELLVVTSHHGCNEEGERDAYM